MHRQLRPISWAGVAMLIVMFTIAGVKQAHAYLDPGSGSYLIQMIIAGAVGAGFFVKSYWQSVKQFFGKLFKKQPLEDENEQ